MDLTPGTMMFYAGIAGVGVTAILIVIILIVFSKSKSRLRKKLNEEYGSNEKTTQS